MNKAKLRILLVLSRSIMPADGGRETLLLDFLKRIKPDFDIHIAFFNNKDETGASLKDQYKNLGISSITVLEKPNFWSISRNFLTEKGTIQEALFYSTNNLDTIIKILKKEDVDLIYFDMLRLYRYARELKSVADYRIIFDLDDLLSIRYKFFLDSKAGFINIFGSYSKFFMKGILPLALKFLLKPVLRYESNACLRREQDVARLADIVLITSPSEKRTFKELTLRSNLVFTNFPIIRSNKDKYFAGFSVSTELVWLGNNHIPHNLTALERLIKEVLPELDNFTLAVAGKTPEFLINTYKFDGRIRFLGFIDDIDVFFEPGKILVAPFVFGTGIKIKLLEAMSKGVAVVTNNIGFQGVPYDGNVCFTPKNNSHEMIDSVKKLSTDHDYLSRWLWEQFHVLDDNFSRSYENEIAQSLSK